MGNVGLFSVLFRGVLVFCYMRTYYKCISQYRCRSRDFFECKLKIILGTHLISPNLLFKILVF